MRFCRARPTQSGKTIREACYDKETPAFHVDPPGLCALNSSRSFSGTKQNRKRSSAELGASHSTSAQLRRRRCMCQVPRNQDNLISSVSACANFRPAIRDVDQRQFSSGQEYTVDRRSERFFPHGREKRRLLRNRLHHDANQDFLTNGAH